MQNDRDRDHRQREDRDAAAPERELRNPDFNVKPSPDHAAINRFSYIVG
jgi:ATP adenylyltransferase/5',5'''-P-1,P-4-tetraphosphate phosphorylase II